jgi:hypothetical protein
VRRLSAALVLLALVAGCTSAPSPTPSPSSLPPTCPASADLPPDAERQGTGDGVTLWALFFGPRVIATQEIKIVWRMTGTGDVTMTAAGPEGRVLKPSWGPQAHSGSNYSRPGDEWGTGWVFPQAGCWTINASRSSGQAHLSLRVDVD